MPTNDDALMVRVTWFDPSTQEQLEQVLPLPITIGRSDGENNTIGLNSRVISGSHAKLEEKDGSIMLTDLGSKNGTYVNGKRIQSEKINDGNSFVLGSFQFTLYILNPPAEDGGFQTQTLDFSQLPPESQTEPLVDGDVTNILAFPGRANDSYLEFDHQTGILVPPSQLSEKPQPRRQFPPSWFTQAETVRVSDLDADHPVETTTYLAVGGGLGSFTWIDHLIVYGADPSKIVSIGFEPKPYGRYRRLCKNSQIPEHERLRSNSDSCPDNVWGWPGYAVREIWGDVKKGKFGNAGKVGWKIFNEPFVETYTPIAGNVFDSIDKEAERIGWSKMWRHGRVRAIRKTDDGRYAVAYSLIQTNSPSVHRFIICNYLHVAVGYPGVRFLRDLQEYRQRTKDFKRVVNAYENHAHVYEDLKTNGGVVMLRGRGIVASRIVQRLFELRRDHGANVGILHLMRTPLAEGQRYKKAQRIIDNHWEFQPFNWPKAAWSGTLRELLEKADDDERDRLLNEWGGTTTADRIDWREMVQQGLREGWYEIQFGNVAQVDKHPEDGVVTVVNSNATVQRRTELVSDYIIDATGLDSSIKSNSLLKDLVEHYQLGLNPKKRLAVSNDFEISGLRNTNARAYASGVITLGGPYAAVDSFLGLQYAALRSVDDLVKAGAPGLKKLNGLRSFAQWTKWARGVQP